MSGFFFAKLTVVFMFGPSRILSSIKSPYNNCLSGKIMLLKIEFEAIKTDFFLKKVFQTTET